MSAIPLKADIDRASGYLLAAMNVAAQWCHVHRTDFAIHRNCMAANRSDLLDVRR